MPSPTTTIFRFNCPTCKRILKAPVTWGGRRGSCPFCHRTLVFPHSALARANSWTAQQLRKIITAEDLPLDESESDKLSMLLAQGTCMEYRLAQSILAEDRLSARQWRRILSLAASRETLRLQFQAHLDRPLGTPPADSDPFLPGSPQQATEPDLFLPDVPSPPTSSIKKQTNADTHHLALTLAQDPDQLQAKSALTACQILSRYLHFLRHDTCPACLSNSTGMSCIYLNYDCFLNAANWALERRIKWERACRESLGLRPEMLKPTTKPKPPQNP